eukprot:198140-Pleurochrysis_carterae.AAC.1
MAGKHLHTYGHKARALLPSVRISTSSLSVKKLKRAYELRLSSRYEDSPFIALCKIPSASRIWCSRPTRAQNAAVSSARRADCIDFLQTTSTEMKSSESRGSSCRTSIAVKIGRSCSHSRCHSSHASSTNAIRS